MAVDLDAIRRRVQELQHGKRSSDINFWRPAPGEYKVRGVPWKNADASMPLVERYFYYLPGQKGLLTEAQFKSEDPIDAFIRELFSSGNPDDRQVAKKLLPKMRAFIAVVDRNKESEGVQIWGLGKKLYERILSFWVDDDVGDILDPKEGFDLKVVVTQAPGRQFPDFQVDPARKPSKLHEDPEVAKKWLESVPNLDDVYKRKSAAELKAALQAYITSGEKDTKSDGKSGGGEEADDLDKVIKDLGAVAGVDSVPETKKEDKKKSKKEEVKTKSIDEAFEDLSAEMGDD